MAIVIDDATHERIKAGGRKGGTNRHSVQVYAASIVKRWPDLTPEKRDEVRAILAPIVSRVEQAGR